MLSGNGRLATIIGPAEMLVPAPGICADPYFNDAAESGLVWLPEHGMGWLNVTDAPYDAAYFDKYRGYAETDMGVEITTMRRNLVDEYTRGELIDVGIGCGAFVEEMGPPRCRGFDVNPAAIAWLNARGLFADPYRESVETLTFWDALEHIPDVHRMVANARRFVFCSLPIVPGDGPPRPDWKHLRRDEHCWYFTRRGLIAWMDRQGFECIEVNAMETLLGRDDIESFCFRRRAC